MNKPFEIALKEYGQLEVAGKLSNKAILNYYKVAGHKWVQDEAVPWCAAYVGYCLETAGIPSTKNLAARSYLQFGTETKDPQLGDIVVLSRGTNPANGHVGFFIKKDKTNIWILGGNQADSVNISKFDISKLLSYRSLPVDKPVVKNDIIVVTGAVESTVPVSIMTITPNQKYWIKSSIQTFLTGFGLAIAPSLSNLDLNNLDKAFLVGLLTAGVRAGIKALWVYISNATKA